MGERIATGEWVVDLRNRVAFAARAPRRDAQRRHRGSFATYLGWLVPWGTPLTLLGDTPEQVAQAQRELVRIGIDRPAAYATGRRTDWSQSYLSGAMHIPLHELPQRMADA